MTTFTFRVPGTPVAKARPRVCRGRAFTPVKTANYEQYVWECAESLIPDGWPYDAEYHVDMTFTFKNRLHGDLDNHVKVLDGLNPNRHGRKGVWFDDKQVRSITATRTYDPANEGLVITLTALPTKIAYFPKRLAERKPRRKTKRIRKTK